MDFNESDIDDLLSNDSFRNWVLEPNDELNSFWNNWMLQNPDNKEKVKQARIIIKALQFDESKMTEKQEAQLFDRIRKTNDLRRKEAVVRPLNEKVRHAQQNKKLFPQGVLLRYAAILTGAIVFAVSIHLILGNFKPDPKVEFVEKVNEKGQKATIYLPDGSIVTLNSSSKLLYPKVFPQDVRKVFLQGEAFFEVTKDSKPFIVETDEIHAKVLGTSFNVKSFPNNEESSVSLLTGKVAVYPPEFENKQIVLGPGEKGSLNKETATLVKMNYDYFEEIAWKDGVLLFRDMPFDLAVKRMEQWYGLEFVVDQMPAGKEYQVTARFDNESLGNVLKSISYTVKFDYEISRNKVFIKFHK